MADKSCPFCGVSAWSQKEGVVVYGCSTSVDPHQVLRSVTCVAKERDILRQRIDAAVKALEGITRCEIYGDDITGVIIERNECGDWVQWDDVYEAVVEILRGNNPTN